MGHNERCRPSADNTGAAPEENTTANGSRGFRRAAVHSRGLVDALARTVQVPPLATHRWPWRHMDRHGRQWATKQFLTEVADALWGKPCTRCGRHHEGECPR